VRALVADFDVSVEVLFAERPNGSPMNPLYRRWKRRSYPSTPTRPSSLHVDGLHDSRFFRSIGIPRTG